VRAGSTRFAVALSLAATILAAAGCGKVESCRPGTLFMTVELGPYSSADELDIDVMLEAAGDAAASAPKQTQLRLKPGSRAGGVEVQFPDGYQAGRTAMITLALISGGSPLAERVVRPVLLPGCGTLTVDFGASDAGSDAEAGGPGTGGAAGSAGTGGTGDAGGAGTGGAGGGATGGKGGGGGGRGGAGGAATGGAGGSPCTKTGSENCFDGIDNDCNGLIDCADPACGATVAQCVALDPTSAPIGLLSGVGTGACGTAGYDQATAIFANPDPLSCTTVIAGKGCSCAAGPVTCSTNLVGFKTLAECTGDTSSGESAGSFVTGQDKNCTAAGVPPWVLDANGDIFGIGATSFVATPADCTPSGTPNVPTYAFGTNATFCATQKVGGGCGAGQVCVPAAAAGGLCQLFDGKKTCPGGAPAQPYYTGVSGTVTCGACTWSAGRRQLRRRIAADLFGRHQCAEQWPHLHRLGRLQAGHRVLGHADAGRLLADERRRRYGGADRSQDALLPLGADLRCGRPRPARRRSLRTSPPTASGGGARRPARRAPSLPRSSPATSRR
jgi:hypothetical protein